MALGLAAGPFAPTASAAVVISDATFTDADWASTKEIDTTPGTVATFTAAQSAGGLGNPDPYRLVTHSYVDGAIHISHVFTAGSYDPATQGAISTLDYTYDLRRFSSDIGLAPLVGQRPSLFQGGTLFIMTTSFSFSHTGWAPFAALGLTQLDFIDLTASSSPDFSAAGALIQFGYFTNNGDPIGGIVTPPSLVTTDSGIDNWIVTVNQVPVQISEPGTLALFGIGLAGLASLRRRKPA